MVTLLFVGGGAVLTSVLAYHRSSARTWIAALAAAMLLVTALAGFSPAVIGAWLVVAACASLLAPTRLRRDAISAPLLRRLRARVPPLSPSERAALDAGTVWWDAELLSGTPDWRRLRGLAPSRLSAAERAFLDGPVHELCEMLDEWRIAQVLHDLPPEAWDYLKRQRFFGILVPEAYGGLGYSAAAHSEIVMKLASRSATAAVTVMVPNALGPAELLLEYGTQAQKDDYLPRLARGEEIPCFALTGPEAGSDAAGIPDFGIVCRQAWAGEPDVLGIRLTWEKRYITLAPVATLIGLAFRLYDPDRLVGPDRELGITLALVPASTPGVHIGRRHRPLDAAFMNGPTWGRDVFVPMQYVIGGVERAGQGWAMLMNCLAAGRAISLPANSCGVAKRCAAASGAYARVRRQFGVPIGRFEGVEAALARIAGNAYVMEAVRHVTVAALDAGEKPAVISAIVKAQLTERVRAVVNDAMDIHGGKGICMGPANYLAQAYQQVPIAITVEGANILTRSLIVFGQGVIRGHPYLLRELDACAEPDAQRALRDFDRALFGHVAFFASNAARTLWLAWTRGRWARTPGDAYAKPLYGQLARYASALAFVTDAVLLAVGGALKRRERLSERLGEVLSLLYVGSCVLKRHEDQGRPAEDRAFVSWAMGDTLRRIEAALQTLFDNLPCALAAALRTIVFPPGCGRAPRSSDRLDHTAAALLLAPGSARDRLTAGLFLSGRPGDAVSDLERAFAAAIAAEAVEARVKQARAAHAWSATDEEAAKLAAAHGIITPAEAERLDEARRLRRAVIMVDDFPRDLDPVDARQTTQAATFDARQHGSTD